MRRNSGFLTTVFSLLLVPSAVFADDPYKVEALKEAPPSSLPAAVKASLNTTGHRVLKEGKPFADIWFRKGIPASAKPAGPNGTILFPVLKEGELLGVLKYSIEGQDYRDQAIPVGLYTLRYGLQPINGAHLGVSPFRDYMLLLPAAKDTSTDVPAKKSLEDRSSEAAGTSHPAVLMMLAPPDPAPKSPSMVRDDAKDTWGALLSLPLAVKGGGEAGLDIQLVVSGAAAP